MRSIRGGSGLGDALYVQSVARHLVEQGEELEICSDWPDVFRPLADRVTVSPFRRDRVDVLAHYTRRRERRDTDQFVDCCMEAGVGPKVEMRLDWTVQDPEFVAPFEEFAPIVLVALPRVPMDRTDKFSLPLIPDWNVVQRAIDLLVGRAFIVQVGKGDALHRFSGIDLDLANRTSVADLLDVASIANAFLGYCSFMVPLAESFGRPGLFVWSRRGLTAGGWIGGLTPQKVLHGDRSRFVIDDCGDADLEREVGALLGPDADSLGL